MDALRVVCGLLCFGAIALAFRQWIRAQEEIQLATKSDDWREILAELARRGAMRLEQHEIHLILRTSVLPVLLCLLFGSIAVFSEAMEFRIFGGVCIAVGVIVFPTVHRDVCVRKDGEEFELTVRWSVVGAAALHRTARMQTPTFILEGELNSDGERTAPGLRAKDVSGSEFWLCAPSVFTVMWEPAPVKEFLLAVSAVLGNWAETFDGP